MKKNNTLYLAQLGILTALVLVLSFTPLGYLTVGAISITFLPVPVVIGAILLGPKAGGILGGVFGVTSFLHCFGLEAFGTFLISVNFFGTLAICMLPRIAFGIISGYIFIWASKIDKTKLVSFALASVSGPIINTALFTGLLLLIFWNNDTFINQMITYGLPVDGITVFVSAFVLVNGLVEAFATLVIGTAISKAASRVMKKSTR